MWNVVIGFNKLIVKLEFAEVSARHEQLCHSEPVRRLVWESPSNSVRPIVIQAVLLHCFPDFIHERRYFYPGDCHTSVRAGSQ